VATRSSALFRSAFLITGDWHEAEDLVQAALERAFRNWRRVVAAEEPEAYVRRILANLAIDGWRRAARRGELPLLPGDRDVPAPEPQRLVEDHDQVIRALHALPVGMRTVIVLRYFDDMADKQIAAMLGLSLGTVKSQSSRAMAKLREAMAPPVHQDPENSNRPRGKRDVA
jgi:RNA polymerase sigma-70 factor (sigma-E family)